MFLILAQNIDFGYTHNLCLEQRISLDLTIFHLKIVSLNSITNRSKLHMRVKMMSNVEKLTLSMNAQGKQTYSNQNMFNHFA